MNEFEKKLFADLQAGHSVDAIMAEFNKHLNVAKAEVAAAKAREEEERKRKLEEEKKKAAEAQARAQKDLDAKKITEIANRALNSTLTSEDVAWMFQRYLFQKWGKSEAVCQVAMTAEDIDTMINMAIKMFDTLDPLMKVTGTKWEDLLDEVSLFTPTSTHTSKKQNKNKSKNDDEVIKDFLNKIL